MSEARVAIDHVDAGVATITLDHPPLNALSKSLLADLSSAAREVGADPGLKAVVVIGAGDRAFAAGADVSEFRDTPATEIAAGFHAACTALEEIPRPVIAAVHGYALGGGLEVAMACDLRVASAEAVLGQPEILLGITPGGGATQRLPRLVGTARAKELLWSGRQVKADEALAIGLVDRVADDARADAVAWASELAAGAVVAMGLVKCAVHAGAGRPLAEGLAAETEAFAESFGTDDARAGIESFLEHGPGKATFQGR